MQTDWRTGPPLYTMDDPIGRPIRTPGALPYTIWVDRSGWPLQSIIDQLASLSPLYYRQPGRKFCSPTMHYSSPRRTTLDYWSVGMREEKDTADFSVPFQISWLTVIYGARITGDICY
jgi:hypothetical protein